MPPKRAKRTHLRVILGAPENDERVPSSPSPPTTSNNPTINNPIVTQQERAPQIKWSAEMIEALVECIYRVWKDGRATDNGFKKEAWVKASKAVKRVYRGPLAIE